jgi:hypothetical protein
MLVQTSMRDATWDNGIQGLLDAVAVGDLDGNGQDDLALIGSVRPTPEVSQFSEFTVAWVPSVSASDVPLMGASVLWSAPDETSRTADEAVRSGADLDGDGTADLVVGNQGECGGANPGGADGAVWILTDRLGGDLDTVAYAVIHGEPDSCTGRAVETADFNGDGQADLAVGRDDGVLVFLGPLAPGDLDAGDATQILHSPSPGDAFGFALAAADLDGDALDELVVGAPWTPNFAMNDIHGDPSKGGAVYIFWGYAIGH